ncbi:MAG: PDZ domain-containing protein [bacterium]
MTMRRVLYLVGSLSLTTAIALAQQPAIPPAPPEPPIPGEPFGQSFSFFVQGGSFLGVYAEDINSENMGRYGMREARGTGITDVVKDSPAEKAGLRKDDVILRFDGETVTSARKLTRLVSEVAPDHRVSLTISRGGSEQEVAVTIAKRKDSSDAMNKLQGLHGKLRGLEGLQGLPGLEGMEEFGTPGARVWKWEGGEPNGDGFMLAFGNNRRIGVSTTTLTKQLADYFGVADGKGVLVTAVTEDGAAAKAGVKAGDVITSLDGEKIEDAGDLARAINKKKEGDVTLTIVRNKNQKTITLTPKQITPRVVQPGAAAPQASGRNIIIPGITLPTIPEMNISVPRIELGATPEINVRLPRTPRIRIHRASTAQPI